ncbi:aliphatic nitrilase [Fusarium agapanthi]|uniref:Aliphatic nitrilase n=1 Tax=Fusarium agapanthi TaxID=1803897 RepID=A0A9P5BF34_9HYPO|nr:aliphatic nitrilase [Fusarium agapanthi]
MCVPIRVAVTQAEPVYLDLAASVKKHVVSLPRRRRTGRSLLPSLSAGYPDIVRGSDEIHLQFGADTEGIVYADLDLTKAVATRGFLDIVAHYSRPDLLWLGVDRQPKENVIAKQYKPAVQEETENTVY